MIPFALLAELAKINEVFPVHDWQPTDRKKLVAHRDPEAGPVAEPFDVYECARCGREMYQHPDR